MVSAARNRANGAASGSSAATRRVRRSSAVANHRHPSAVVTHQWWLPKPTGACSTDVTSSPHAEARASRTSLVGQVRRAG